MDAIKVGIADDNQEFCILLHDFLADQLGIDVVATFNNGYEVIEALNHINLDILLLDLIMPRMDGLEVLQWIHDNQLRRVPKIIIFSAFGQEDIARNAVSLGAYYYILKPFDLNVLAKRIIEISSQKSQPTIIQKNWKNSSLESEIVQILEELKIPAHFKGYGYLREAILATIAEPGLINEVTKGLYPLIAERYNTTMHRVERSMRFAIETAWNKGEIDFLHELFGYCIDNQKGKPTNASFIAKIADKIRLERKVKVF